MVEQYLLFLPWKKVIKTNLLRAAWLPKVYSPRLLLDKEVEEELHFGYICLANTSCTLLSHNCFRFRYKSNRNLIRFLPRPNNKLHNFKAEISGRKHRVEKGRGKYMKELYSRLYFKQSSMNSCTGQDSSMISMNRPLCAMKCPFALLELWFGK